MYLTTFIRKISMNLKPVARRHVALVSAFSAALIATAYAASEHDRADFMECRARGLEMNAAQLVSSSPSSHDAEVSADDSPLPKVRQAARDYIQENKPGAKVEGIFTLSYGRDTGLFIAGADTTVDGRRRTIDLLVRLYTRKSGGTYWRAESLGPDRTAAMMDKAMTDASNTLEAR
jgi:hypothetical protein